jgi:hypothetical protein
MTSDQMPPLPSTIGKRGSYKDPDGTRLPFTVVDEVRREQSSYAYVPEGEPLGAVLVLQLLRFDNGIEELRLGYYILGKKPAMRGKWLWGQYAASMPPEDFEALVKQAIDKGWIRSEEQR